MSEHKDLRTGPTERDDDLYVVINRKHSKITTKSGTVYFTHKEEECVSGEPIITIVSQAESTKGSPLKLKKPPGQLLLEIVEIVVSTRRYETTFEPLVADWRKEYFDALRDDRGRAKMFFINARYVIAFAWAFACGIRSLWNVVDKAAKFFSSST